MYLWCFRTKLFAMFLKLFHLREVKKECLASKHMHLWCLSGPKSKICSGQWHIKCILWMKVALRYCSVKPVWCWISFSSSNAVSVDAMGEVLRDMIWKCVMSRTHLASLSGIICPRMKGSIAHRASVAADVCLTLMPSCRWFFWMASGLSLSSR